MTDGLLENTYTKQVLPTEKSSVPNFLYIILITLVILILIVAGFYFYLKNNKKNISTTKQSAVKLSNLEIAQKTSDWLDTQKNSGGIYNVGQVCQENFTQCKSLGESHYSGIPVIWGRFNLYLKNKDQKDLNLVESDIDNYTEMVKTKTIGTNTEGCRLLYDLWKNDAINETYKQKIATICSKFVYPDFLNYKEITKTDDELSVSIDQKIDQILQWQPGENINMPKEYTSVIEKSDYDFNFLPSIMSEYLVDSQILKKDYFQTQVNKIFDILLEDLPSKLYSPNNNRDFICQVGKSALEFSLINNHGKSLELAQKLAKIGFEDSNIINCALLASRLKVADAANQTTYSDYLNNFLKTNIDNNFSGPSFWKKDEDGLRRDVGRDGLMVGLLNQ